MGRSLSYFREALRIYRLHSEEEVTGRGEDVWSTGDGDQAEEYATKTLENIKLVEKNLSRRTGMTSMGGGGGGGNAKGGTRF